MNTNTLMKGAAVAVVSVAATLLATGKIAVIDTAQAQAPASCVFTALGYQFVDRYISQKMQEGYTFMSLNITEQSGNNNHVLMCK
jgi:hypothetical protein